MDSDKLMVTVAGRSFKRGRSISEVKNKLQKKTNNFSETSCMSNKVTMTSQLKLP